MKSRSKKKVLSATEKLALAKRHLERVEEAWDDPTDWDNLSLYGFYCIEATVEAAAIHLKLRTSTRHWEKADLAAHLHADHGLPDVSQLLVDLNDARKEAAYGDIDAPDLDAESIATDIGHFVNAVSELLSRTKSK